MNPEKHHGQQRRHRQRHPMQNRINWIRNQYGLTLAEYEAMLKAQGGKCAICSSPPSGNRALAIDHDHATGKVRALLCMKCNTGLGAFNDCMPKIEAALSYLKKHSIENEAIDLQPN